ncbi:MAG: glycine C-acetyltransferase, partial [Labilithrix sp.]|nr:glycine C-acetyltransferase [Labilithrix sp.]
MFGRAQGIYETTLNEIREAGLYKEERVIVTPQAASIGVGTGAERRDVVNFCANNYLGLSSHP